MFALEKGWLIKIRVGGERRRGGSEESTHGVSSITRHTQAMVLRQSVVSSMGKVLFWRTGTKNSLYA